MGYVQNTGNIKEYEEESQTMRHSWSVIFCDKVKADRLCHLKGSRGGQCEPREGPEAGGQEGGLLLRFP